MFFQAALLSWQELARQAPPPEHDGGGQDGFLQVYVEDVDSGCMMSCCE